MATLAQAKVQCDGLNLPVCICDRYAQEHSGSLAPTLQALVDWGNTRGYRDPTSGAWHCPADYVPTKDGGYPAGCIVVCHESVACGGTCPGGCCAADWVSCNGAAAVKYLVSCDTPCKTCDPNCSKVPGAITCPGGGGSPNRVVLCHESNTCGGHCPGGCCVAEFVSYDGGPVTKEFLACEIPCKPCDSRCNTVTGALPCSGTTCPTGQHIENGVCVPDTGISCPTGQHVENGKCVADIKTCPSGQHLDANGNCVANTITCPSGQHEENGVCVVDATTCPTGYTLSQGVCVKQGGGGGTDIGAILTDKRVIYGGLAALGIWFVTKKR